MRGRSGGRERTPQLNNSLSSRRRRTIVGGAVLTLALGALATAVPAEASAGSPATAAPGGAAAESTTVTPLIEGGSPPHGTAVPVPAPSTSGTTNTISFTASISDSLNPSGVTTPDAIVTCAPSHTTVNDYDALVIPAGCLTLYNGEWIKVTWSGPINDYLLLTQQTDGNLVLTYSVEALIGPEWTSNTTFAGNANGPGCLAQFKSTGNLVVDNCDGTQIYTTGTASAPNAVLVFGIGADDNFQIFNSLGGSVIWSG